MKNFMNSNNLSFTNLLYYMLFGMQLLNPTYYILSIVSN